MHKFSQESTIKHSLICTATFSALAVLATAAGAGTTDWNLQKFGDHANYLDLYAFASSATTGSVDVDITLTNEAVQSIRSNSDPDFGKFGSQPTDTDDVWSTASGYYLSQTNSTLDALKATVATEALEGLYVDVSGIFHRGIADLTVKGATQLDVVSNIAGNLTSGVIIENVDSVTSGTSSLLQFEGGADINVKALGADSIAAGLFLRSSPTNPSAVFSGDSTAVTAEATGTTVGLALVQDDFSNHEGQDVEGTLTLQSTKTTVDVKSTGNERSIGILATGSNTLNIETALTVNTHDTNDFALWVGNDEEAKNSFGEDHVLTETVAGGIDSRTSETSIVVGKDASVQLKGNTFLGSKAKVTLQGDLSVSGDLETLAGINGSDSGSLHLVEGSFKGHESVSAFDKVTLGNVTLQNGTIRANNLFINGSVKNEDVELEGTSGSAVVFEDGGRFENLGSLHFDEIVLNTGSLYLEEEKEFQYTDDGGLILTLGKNEGSLDFAGGRLGVINDESKTIDEILFESSKDNSRTPTVIRYSNGSYKLKKVSFAEGNEASLEVNGGNLTVDEWASTAGQAFVKDNGDLSIGKLTSAGNFGMTVKENGSLTVDAFDASSGTFTLSGNGSMQVGTISISDGASLAVNGANIATTSGQIFTIALNADGTNIAETNTLKYDTQKLSFNGGSLSLTDAKFNQKYADTAASIFQKQYQGSGITFTGVLVDESGEIQEEVDLDDINEGQIFENTNITANAGDDGTVSIDKTVGGETLVIKSGTSVNVSPEKTLTLAGSETGGELIQFNNAENTSITVDGALALGSEQKATKGEISTGITLGNGNLGISVKGGNFALNNVDASAGTSFKVANTGTLSIDALTVGQTVTIDGPMNVKKLSVTNGNAFTRASGNTLTVLSGRLTVDAGDLTELQVDVGNPSSSLAETASSSTAASAFVYGETTANGSIRVNQNAVVAIGTTDLSGFDQVFADGFATWSDTTSAAFIAGPVTIADDASLAVGGSSEKAVTFGENSILVADITSLGDKPLLTADGGFSVSDKSVAYLIGTAEDGTTYKLTSDENINYWNTKDTLKSGSAMLEINFNEDGAWTVSNIEAAKAYGSLMQGHALADAGYRAQGASGDYAKKLLSDTAGLGKAAVAARFDAAMNPGGSLAVFTTAYDRASDLRRIVREEASVKGYDQRLWAQVTGGKTKLDGISTGAQSIDVETDAYGLAIGGEAMAGSWKIGAALNAGTGDTENDFVRAKDDFDFYGLSIYGQKTVGHYDFLLDASYARVNSDLTVDGVADLDADTATTVWSAGAEVRRTADLGWISVTPFIGANLYHVDADGYNTNHGVRVADANATAVEFPIGAELGKSVETTNGLNVRPAFSLAVVPTVGDKDIDQQVSFAGVSDTYNFTFADDVKIRTNLSVMAETDEFAFGLKAGYEWGDEERGSTTFSLNAQYRF